MLPPIVENLSVYADFYHTVHILEAARNRVLNGCKTTDRTRITPDQEAKITAVVWRIYNKLFEDGKQAVEEVRRRLLAATQAHHDNDLTVKKQQMELAAEWCRALTKTNRNIMKVVTFLSDALIEHSPTNEADITPPANVSRRIDMNNFAAKMEELWKTIIA